MSKDRHCTHTVLHAILWTLKCWWADWQEVRKLQFTIIDGFCYLHDALWRPANVAQLKYKGPTYGILEHKNIKKAQRILTIAN